MTPTIAIEEATKPEITSPRHPLCLEEPPSEEDGATEDPLSEEEGTVVELLSEEGIELEGSEELLGISELLEEGISSPSE